MKALQAFVLVPALLLSFACGTIAGRASVSPGIAIAAREQPTPVTATESKDIYASVRGTRFYYAHCSSTVKEENKIWFSSEEEAAKAGYALSASCKKR